LPDIAVAKPTFLDGRLVAFAGSAKAIPSSIARLIRHEIRPLDHSM
jgi:hypothetical protein